MLRWLIVCASLCVGAYFLVAWLAGPSLIDSGLGQPPGAPPRAALPP